MLTGKSVDHTALWRTHCGILNGLDEPAIMTGISLESSIQHIRIMFNGTSKAAGLNQTAAGISVLLAGTLRTIKSHCDKFFVACGITR
jgi:hypothetical protein